MKKKILSIIFAAAMMMSLPAAAFAADAPTVPIDPIESSVVNDGVSVMSVSSTTVNTDRLSNTSGKVVAYGTFSSNASKAVCTIYLQEKYNGSWRTATGLGTTSYTKTAYNCNSITAGKTFTLKSGKVYRAKCVFSGIINGTTHTKTFFSGSF